MNDDKLKNILAGTKLKAGENLKYRIMQQIETENMLSKSHIVKKEAILTKNIKNLLTITGIAYGLIALVTLGSYLYFDNTEFLFSTMFWMVVIFITVISFAIGIINHFDEKIRKKLGAKNNKIIRTS